MADWEHQHGLRIRWFSAVLPRSQPVPAPAVINTTAREFGRFTSAPRLLSAPHFQRVTKGRRPLMRKVVSVLCVGALFLLVQMAATPRAQSGPPPTPASFQDSFEQGYLFF